MAERLKVETRDDGVKVLSSVDAPPESQESPDVEPSTPTDESGAQDKTDTGTIRDSEGVEPQTSKEGVESKAPDPDPAEQDTSDDGSESGAPDSGPVSNFQQYFPDYESPEKLKEDLERLKATQLELDEFEKEFINRYRSGDDLTKYIEAKTTDFDGMTDEQIMRRHLRNQYPSLSKESFDILYDREVTQKFKLNSDENEEQEVALGRELLKEEANKLRKGFKEEYEKYLVPKKSEEDQARLREEEQKILEDWTKTVKSHPSTKGLLEQKKIKVKYGDKEFAYEVGDPNSIVDATIDNSMFFELFSNGDKDNPEIDFDKFYRVVAFAQDYQNYEKSLIDFGKNLGTERVIDDLENPELPAQQSVDGDGYSSWQEKALKEALKKRG